MIIYPQMTQTETPAESPRRLMEKDKRTFSIIGAAMEVHRELGCGFLEPVYQEALAIELKIRNIPFKREVNLELSYKGKNLSASYRVDFICYGSIIVELKALTRISSVEESQIINYLKASGLEIGLLINFGLPRLEYKRFAYTHHK
jgi:GxxExxY protein